jgi:hypothetical protein
MRYPVFAHCLGGLALACGGAAPPELAAPAPVPGSTACLDRSETRNVYWGDLHVHTTLSRDAFNSDVRGMPDGAYRFAKGESIGIPPLDAAGNALQSVRLARPLDFAAVTDHAEGMGTIALCARPDSPAYESESCRQFRMLPAHKGYPLPPGLPPRKQIFESICGGPDLPLCNEARSSTWQTIKTAAARWNDTSRECSFTTFVAYEWSGARGGPLLHRNVIFRNAVAPLPVSSLWDPTPHDLWRRLDAECLQAGNGCDVLAIPHNSNTSQGHMFNPEYPGAQSLVDEARQARRRRDLEPLVEVMQHKGDSECGTQVAGVLGTPDELCDFEKTFRGAPTCVDLDAPIDFTKYQPCQSTTSYARTALAIGLAEEQRIGVNPFEFGLIAATDTHNATPGAVSEVDWKGHLGNRDATRETRLATPRLMRPSQSNPGGLAAVWAEENSRESLFQAMRRRETYGTSGPRMLVRFFGGWDVPDDLCEQSDFAARGYAAGVPMGGELAQQARPGRAPSFAVSALRDPGSEGLPGGLLQRVQIIKVWPGEEGVVQQRVVDVAGDTSGEVEVDVDTCEPSGPGADQLCTVWRDPDFDPDQAAAYYARVIENPSCRWSRRQCLSVAEAERPPACSDGNDPFVVQERAWTSPIWYRPERDGA